MEKVFQKNFHKYLKLLFKSFPTFPLPFPTKKFHKYLNLTYNTDINKMRLFTFLSETVLEYDINEIIFLRISAVWRVMLFFQKLILCEVSDKSDTFLR